MHMRKWMNGEDKKERGRGGDTKLEINAMEVTGIRTSSQMKWKNTIP